MLASLLVLGPLAASGCAAESDESDLGEAEMALSVLPRVRSIDYAGAVPGQVRYEEGWDESPLLNGWQDPEDRHLTGDFMGLGYDQTLHFNRNPAGGRVMIVDYAGGAAPGQVRYWENWGDSPLLNGWTDDGDLQLAGDFLGLGHDQVLYVNRQQGGGKIMIVDYAGGAAPGQVRYWESWGDSPLLSGWLDDGDRQIVGDFRGVGHDEILFYNRQPGGGRVMIVDYGAGAVPGQVPYWESWGDSPLLDGWTDDGDLQLAGDFRGLGRDQVLYMNRQPGGGRVMIVDYAGGVPGSVPYWESWGDSPLLNGWTDDGDLQLVGDFRGSGHDQVLYVNRQEGGGKVMVVDYTGGVPGQVPYWESWGQAALMDDLIDRGDLHFVGDFANVGHAQVQWSNLSSVHLAARKFAPRLRFDSAIHGYPMSAQTFYEQAVAAPQTYRVENLDYGSIANNSVPTYYQAIKCGDQIRLMYWWFYGYQSECDAFGNGTHNGDWEHVMVTLSEDASSMAAVTYWMHGKRLTRLAARGGFSVEDGTHPVVYVGKASHASFYGQGGSSNTCLPWEEYRNNGNGTHMDSWNYLVDLNGNAEPWLAADRAGGFDWGAGGVGTHPTTDGPSCDLNAADWSFEVPTWWHSQCKVGDDDSGTFCVQQCEPGYDEYPLTCTSCSGFWPWEWSCSTYNRDTYGYDWTIPTSDVGLLVDDY
ncbi:MAG: hypothetical protein R3B70_12990 [Polyangiaceae bacterium]